MTLLTVGLCIGVWLGAAGCYLTAPTYRQQRAHARALRRRRASDRRFARARRAEGGWQ